MKLLLALYDLALIAALAIYLALMGEHHALPEGFIYRGGPLRIGEEATR